MLALAKASLLYAIGCCVPCGIDERIGNEIKNTASKRDKPIKNITQQRKAGTYRAPIHSLGNNLAAVWIHHDHRDGRKLVGLGCLDGKRCNLVGNRQRQSLRRSEYCHCVFLGVQEDAK